MSVGFLFLLSAFVSFGLGVPTRNLLVHAGIIDHPNERSSHNVPTARGGGLPIIFTILAGIGWRLSRELALPLLAMMNDDEYAQLQTVLASFWHENGTN